MVMYPSIEAARVAQIDLVSRIQGIDHQLTQRAAEVTGRVDDEKYKQYKVWKARAVGAKAVLVNKLQHTKLWIAQEHQKQNGRGGGTPLLADLHALTTALVAQGAVIDSHEKSLLDDVSAFLKTN